jgi:hypothetical protein
MNDGPKSIVTTVPRGTATGARGDWTFTHGSPFPHAVDVAGNDAFRPAAWIRAIASERSRP